MVDSVCSIFWCSLTAIWALAVHFLECRKIEEALRQAHDELEVRVRNALMILRWSTRRWSRESVNGGKRNDHLVSELLWQLPGDGRQVDSCVCPRILSQDHLP